MRVSNKIKKQIMEDNLFCLALAAVMNIQQRSLWLLVERDSDRLTLHACVEFYKSKGYTEDEIFEKETEKAAAMEQHTAKFLNKKQI